MGVKTVVWTPENGATRVLARCDELAACSDDFSGLTRLFLSPALAAAHRVAAGWMREAGLSPRVDALGNLIGQRAGWAENAPLWMVGSHLDTVPNAGKYDGMLGVLLGIEVAASLQGEKLPFGLEIIGFSDEEGVRFKTPFLGSRAVAGRFDPNFLELRDAQGTSMREAMENFGLEADAWPSARCETKILGYLEAHIEQGPRLESLGAPLGIVSAIAGQSRARLRFCGESGHAGTLPMAQRRDALAAASEWVLAVEAVARSVADLVATVGWVEVTAGAANVVAGEVMCSLDVRHADDNVREKAAAELVEAAAAICQRRRTRLEIVSQASQLAVPMDAALCARLGAILGPGAPEIVSGAGHDAAIMAAVAPCAMLFLRTPGGKSHCPQEAVNAEDVALALGAMRDFVLQSR